MAQVVFLLNGINGADANIRYNVNIIQFSFFTLHGISISIGEFCIWLVVKHELDRDCTNFIKFVHFTHLPSLGKIVMDFEPPTFQLPGSSLYRYTIMITAYENNKFICNSTAHTYPACMYAIPTYAGYLLLYVYFMQNTCKHFPCMHTLMLHSHKPTTCTFNTGTLHPHTMPLASCTCVCLQCAFMVCLSACCLCLQHAWWHHSCGACVCATTCMWHACVKDASSQCMCMHVGGMHTCNVWHACVCGTHSCSI